MANAYEIVMESRKQLVDKMIRLMEQRSRNVFQLKEGTLYPILHTLEQQGAVTSFQQTADTGKIRKYYAITPHGKKLLKEKTQEWKTYEAAVNQVLEHVVIGGV